MEKSGAMARLLIVTLFAGLLLTGGPAYAQAAAPAIISPTDGQYVQSVLQVKGTTDVPNFASAELDFAYASDPTQTWFVIQTSSLPVTGDTLATWDTSLITDGDYVLRLRATALDGTSQDARITVHVRNYTALPTPTAAITPTQPPVLEIPTAIIIVTTEPATATLPPPIYTPTSLPPNPAGITPAAVFSGFWRGVVLVGVIVAVVGALVRIRR